MSGTTVWLSCGVLRAELEELHRRGALAGELLFLDSMLHMDPPTLEARLTEILKGRTRGSACLILVYGDCSAGMLDLVRDYRVGRVPVINCVQLLVGKERYRQLMREEAFVILPEWSQRWEHIVKDELGLNQVVAHGLIGENRRVLVYLDTGLAPVPEEHLKAFSSYTGLPWRVDTVALDAMLSSLLSTRAGACSELSEGSPA
jgi:hypothetical protein